MEIERTLTENFRTMSVYISRVISAREHCLKKTKNFWQSIQWVPYLLGRYSISRERIQKSEMSKIFLATWESQTVQEALKAENSNKWIQAINKELKENETDGTIYKCKNYRRNYRKKLCMLCTEGWDYKETFSFVVKYDTVRFVLSIPIVKDLEMIQLTWKLHFCMI